MGRSGNPTVAIVIPCFQQRRFLRKAIDSARGQSIPPDEVIVIDDGSTEDLSKVTGVYPDISLIRQENRGLAGARNSGLRAATSDRIIFLDADDVLHSNAIASGLDCFRENPEAAFVYGGFCDVTRKTREQVYTRVTTHRDLIRTNWIGMIATVMFDRPKLITQGGFDESLGMCEDWDSYLRLSRDHPFASHSNMVADYVRHDLNASSNLPELRKWIAVVRAKEWDRGLDSEDRQAWLEGEALWRSRIPDPKPRSLIERTVRKAARRALRPFRT
jgi:glycosyltransferase involved in cell wall biosynthesis